MPNLVIWMAGKKKGFRTPFQLASFGERASGTAFWRVLSQKCPWLYLKQTLNSVGHTAHLFQHQNYEVSELIFTVSIKCFKCFSNNKIYALI
jgi:hypothetical protein